MITATDLTVGFADQPLIEGLSFDVPPRGVLALIGASGSGKTTLLRAMAGLHPPSAGQIGILGKPPRSLFGTGRVQFLHQSPALWKHLTVWEHVRLGLVLVGDPVRRARIDAILEQVGLAASAGKYPHELSVGMKARLALARAFAAPPEILLMDEPFASLDPLRREQLNLYVQSLRDDARCTVVMVTHDIVEAMRFATQFLIFPGRSNHLLVQDNPLLHPITDPNRLDDTATSLRDAIAQAVRPSQTAVAA